MRETIYTIPVNEAFDIAAQSESEAHEKLCPFCGVYAKLQENELELIMGASMMEPAVRIQTNKTGFCGTHYKMMFERGNRLGLALILESHLNEIIKDITPSKLPFGKDGNSASARLEKLGQTCYICDRIEYALSRMMSTTILLWANDEPFRKKFDAQGWFCLPHFAYMLGTAKAELNKKQLPDFMRAAMDIEMGYFKELSDDVSWFVKKFDYNYSSEPYYNSKDSVERALKFLG